jgi:hypothetical protein
MPARLIIFLNPEQPVKANIQVKWNLIIFKPEHEKR